MKNNRWLKRYKTRTIIVVERDLISSKAFHSLRGCAPQVLLVFLDKRIIIKRKHGKREYLEIINNGEIVFTYSEAKNQYGITKDRYTRAIDQLIEVGFLDIAVYGGGLVGRPTMYIISDRWKLYGTSEFIHATRRSRDYQFGYCKKKQK